MRIQILVLGFLFSCISLNAQLMMESVEASDTATFTYHIEGQEPIRLKVEVVGDQLIAGGDMIVGSLTDLDAGRGGAITRDPKKRWPDGIIPYKIATNHPLADQIDAAFLDLEYRTNLIIMPREMIDTSLYHTYVYIDSNPENGCRCNVGMGAEITYMNLAPKCGSQGVIQHQMLHAAGFFHEQMRRDRGEYIKIMKDNIWPEKFRNFKKYPYGDATAIGKYDYESIMQYSGYTDDSQIAIDVNKPIITTKDPTKQNLLGSGTLSDNDIRQINRVYKEDGRSNAFTGRSKKAGASKGFKPGSNNDVPQTISPALVDLFTSIWGEVFSGSISGQNNGDAQPVTEAPKRASWGEGTLSGSPLSGSPSQIGPARSAQKPAAEAPPNGEVISGSESDQNNGDAQPESESPSNGAFSRLSKQVLQVVPIPFMGGRGGQSNQPFNIQFEVELVPQQTGMSCWAAGAAMLVGWYDGVCINPEEIASRIDYWAQYDSDGLTADDLTMLDYWFLQVEPPQSYTVEGFVQLLGVYGPLWVATNEGNPHIRVVAGASGDGTPEGTILTIYDPWQRGMRRFRPNNTGSIYQETFAEFERKNHELAETEKNIASPIYIAHNY